MSGHLHGFFLLLGGHLQINAMYSDSRYFMVSFLKIVRLDSDPHNWGTLIVSRASSTTGLGQKGPESST